MKDQTTPDEISKLALIPVKIKFLPAGTREEALSELSIITDELSEHKRNITDYKRALQEIMFLATHKVRQPITQLLGLSNMLVGHDHSQAELKQIAAYLLKSMSALDLCTR